MDPIPCLEECRSYKLAQNNKEENNTNQHESKPEDLSVDYG
jgi:hypothetical protein